MRVLTKLKIELPHDPEIPFLSIYLKKFKIVVQKDICIPMCLAALFTTDKIQKQPKCSSIEEWTKKLWYIYTVDYYLAIRKNEILPFGTA